MLGSHHRERSNSAIVVQNSVALPDPNETAEAASPVPLQRWRAQCQCAQRRIESLRRLLVRPQPPRNDTRRLGSPSPMSTPRQGFRRPASHRFQWLIQRQILLVVWRVDKAQWLRVLSSLFGSKGFQLFAPASIACQRCLHRRDAPLHQMDLHAQGRRHR